MSWLMTKNGTYALGELSRERTFPYPPPRHLGHVPSVGTTVFVESEL